MISGNSVCRLCHITSPEAKINSALSEVYSGNSYRVFSISADGFSYGEFTSFFKTGNSDLDREVLKSIVLGNVERVISCNRENSNCCKSSVGVVALAMSSSEGGSCEPFTYCWDCNAEMFGSICGSTPSSSLLPGRDIKFNGSCSMCRLGLYGKYTFLGDFFAVGRCNISMLSCSTGNVVSIPSLGSRFLADGMIRCDPDSNGDVFLHCHKRDGSEFSCCKKCVADVSKICSLSESVPVLPREEESSESGSCSYWILISVGIIFLYLIALLILAIWASVDPSFLTRF
ncbi:hypothetical protein [Candidatus Ichthyocystis hellenicum]|uniref:hypothetical protein n=1 Tax=Candidatus Ichthyocystis hellenicum TaxID=1561003 RepID=UPI000B84EC1C|nr:hypothetical protein [Candidatus Ichthyocystis hellenicum]